MRHEYGIFRAFCIVAIILLSMLLVTTGILTVNCRNEQTVFGKKYDIVQIYERKDGAIISAAGKITEIEPGKMLQKLDILSYTVFAPINNIIELVKILIHR